ncbi:MAG: response regulator [Clostridia bacterium]|nr:response regulator [Clostridia bacterium]
MKTKKSSTLVIAAGGGVIVMLILVLGTIWMGQSARQDTEEAVRSVSLLYLDELADRREQVVEGNLFNKIDVIQIAIALMDETDLSDITHLEAYQARIRQLYSLDKFAFVDTSGLIYTSRGTQTNIDEYKFDYQNMTGPDISILNLHSDDKKVIIAVPVDHIPFNGAELVACFMEIDMAEMLSGVSMKAQEGGATFCNIYTSEGIALSNTVLGGLAVEDNLLEAMSHAVFEKGYSYETVVRDFEEGKRGEVSFTYNGILETLAYVPVSGTNWLLTYLIRESVISEKISTISNGIIVRSVIQSLLTIAVLLGMSAYMIAQTRKASRLALEKETAETENRIKQEALEQRLTLQEKLLSEEKHRSQQDSMITAMASDYRIVYHVDLDHDDAVCYRADPEDPEQTPEGVHFPYQERFRWYAAHSVAEDYRDGFLAFIEPDNIRKGLEHEPILAYRYLAQRMGKEYYEMIRVAGVRHAADRIDHRVHAIGLGLTVIDTEMRQAMEQQQALSDALKAAEEASRAKTTFLSNMSHEIRTPMNAIIGLDNIALNDPDTPQKTREYLQKIGSSAEHLLGLINDILDMSRIESGRMILKKEEFSFPKLLEAINTMFSGQCSDKGLDYQCHIEGQLDDYYIGDNMKLRQVLINILGNAVKFTPEGGTVSLDVKRTAQFDGLSTLCFVISDTGIGMSRDYLPHIFDTFSQEDSSATNRYGSSGLGMAITKNIVEMMNGSIQVDSEKGKGSTFTVYVTLLDSERTDGEDKGEIRPQDMTVLIVDDDPVACEHAKLVLGKAGISAEVAVSGTAAIEMVRLRHARMEPYDLILVDWKMPDMDGVETTRQIRTIAGNESAIIILTAYKWDDVFEEAVRAGVDSFISKPVFAGTVIEEFRTAIERKGIRDRKKAQKPELAGRHILLAEDVQVNAEIMMMVLQMRQMQADLAVNGKIAVEMFEKHPENYYSAILMDMRMPEMDGLEATRVIRSMDRPDAGTIPIIALTANAFDEDVQRSMQAGLNAHLSKPVQPDILFETLERLIAQNSVFD